MTIGKDALPSSIAGNNSLRIIQHLIIKSFNNLLTAQPDHRHHMPNTIDQTRRSCFRERERERMIRRRWINHFSFFCTILVLIVHFESWLYFKNNKTKFRMIFFLFFTSQGTKQLGNYYFFQLIFKISIDNTKQKFHTNPLLLWPTRLSENSYRNTWSVSIRTVSWWCRHLRIQHQTSM